jgi:transcriptional regulator with XRE-family HTH domain
MQKMEGFGERLTNAMRQAGMDGPTLGSIMGVTRQTVTNWKKDRNFPKADQIFTLCRALRVPADYLIFDLAQPLSLPAIRIATGYDRLTPTQQTQWEKALDLVKSAGPREFDADASQPFEGEGQWGSEKRVGKTSEKSKGAKK